ncbi:hypothetical protein CDIK_4506, partial [Cucumispora dikerogammari]
IFPTDLQRATPLIYFFLGIILLAIGSHINFIADFFLCFIAITNLSFGYIIHPYLNQEPEFFTRDFLVCYFLITVFLAALSVIVNILFRNILLVCLTCFILDLEYRKLLNTLDTPIAIAVESSLLLMSFIILTGLFYDLVPSFLFCLCGISLIFISFDISNKKEWISNEYIQAVFFVVFMACFVYQVRAKDRRFYLRKREVALKK